MTGKRVMFFQYIRKVINKLSISIGLYPCDLYAPNIFEKLGFDASFKFMIENNLLSGTQSGFKPNDSCINQLILITHNVFSVFDANPSLEIRGFLDLSKAFDRVWHRDLLHKLKNRGIIGNLLDLIESFLYNRCKRLVLIGQPFN